MKQPIAGVAPSELDEVTVMTVWPSVAAYPLGRWLGRLYNIKWPNVYIFRLGNLLALASIPLAVALYFYRLTPSILGLRYHGTWYRLTNRRVMAQRNEVRPGTARLLGVPVPTLRYVCGVETGSIPLDGFDAITLDMHDGQQWFDAADLVFRQGGAEAFRLAGVSRPEPFRHACLKAHRSHVGVREALQRERESASACEVPGSK
jgi:hypothetical protein